MLIVSIRSLHWQVMEAAVLMVGEKMKKFLQIRSGPFSSFGPSPSSAQLVPVTLVGGGGDVKSSACFLILLA